MYAWESIQNTLDYIEDHYSEEITIEELSAIAHLSKYYYQRLFYRLVNRNVTDYIKLRRLEKAAKQLKHKDERILDIALACGFNSHSAFTKAFKEVYDITPEYYRNSQVRLDYFIKPNLMLDYVIVDIGVPLVADEMVLEIHKKRIEEEELLIGKSTISKTSEISQPKVNTMVLLWDDLEKQIEIMKKDAKIGVGVDVLWSHENPDCFNYFVGVEADQEVVGYDKWTIPQGNYIVCTYEAENFQALVDEALYKASRYLFDVWVPNQNITVDNFLIQKYYNPKEENCYIELWVKYIEE